MKRGRLVIALACIGILAGCASTDGDGKMAKNTFGDDVKFLKRHTDVVILSDASGARRLLYLKCRGAS